MAQIKRRPFVIVQDTREQLPFRFSRDTPVISKALKYGDYSVYGMEWRVAVERKSFDDLFYSFTKTRLRMLVRLDELAQLDAAALVIECSIANVIAGHPRTVVVGSRLLGTILVECARRGVLALFCNGRRDAAMATEHFLRAYAARESTVVRGGVDWLANRTAGA